jgi:CBS domain-containing protein
MRVSDLMTKNVVSVGVNDPCSTAARLMWDCDCGAVPVMGEGGDKVVGMITDRDICMATWSQNAAPSDLRVAHAMSRELYFCAPQDGVGLAENVMRSKQVRRIPVVDGDQHLIGILSLADIARARDRAGTPQVVPQEVATTLADICQPASITANGASAGSSASAAL